MGITREPRDPGRPEASPTLLRLLRDRDRWLARHWLALLTLLANQLALSVYRLFPSATTAQAILHVLYPVILVGFLCCSRLPQLVRTVGATLAFALLYYQFDRAFHGSNLAHLYLLANLVFLAALYDKSLSRMLDVLSADPHRSPTHAANEPGLPSSTADARPDRGDASLREAPLPPCESNAGTVARALSETTPNAPNAKVALEEGPSAARRPVDLRIDATPFLPHAGEGWLFDAPVPLLRPTRPNVMSSVLADFISPALIASNSVAVLAVDRDWRIQYCNHAAGDLLNVDAAAILGVDVHVPIDEFLLAFGPSDYARRSWQRIFSLPFRPVSFFCSLNAPARRDLAVWTMPLPRQGTDADEFVILLMDVTQPIRRILKGERDRISMDLHDGIMQDLYALGLRMQLHGDTTGPIAEAVQVIESLSAKARDYLSDLGLREFGELGIGEGLVTIAEQLLRDHPIARDIRSDPALEARLDGLALRQVLYVAREAISNALRHASPHEVRIRAVTEGEKLILTVEDDGLGYHGGEASPQGYGIRNMTERAKLLDGTFSIERRPHGGTCVRLEVPLRSQPSVRRARRSPHSRRTHASADARNA